MAETPDGEEKSEEPTGKRLDDSRSKGQVPRSRELVTLMSLLAASVGLLILGPQILRVLVDILREGFTLTRDQVFDQFYVFAQLQSLVVKAIEGLALFFLLLLITGVVGNTILSGWVFASQNLGFKFGKLNPLKGIKRLFGIHGLIELGKSIIKFSLIMPIAIALLWHEADQILGLGLETVPDALAHMADLVLWTFVLLASSLVILVLFDVPYQLWNHKRQLKMTKQEVKEERKQSDGSPEVKSRQRRLMMEAAIKRMMAAVPQADVVVTNPTHFAAALKYDPEKMRAPLLVAKGADLVAARIRAEAEANDVPIVPVPPLARALYYGVELDQEVPMALYVAVAQVLAYVYQVKGVDGAEAPPFQADLDIPDEFLHGGRGSGDNSPP